MLIDQALTEAGLADALKARCEGTPLPPDALERLAQADLLLLGAAADRVRAADVGDEVSIYLEHRPKQLTLIDASDGDGTELVRKIALMRLKAEPGTNMCIDYASVGLSFALTTLPFGINAMSGPLATQSALPLLENLDKARFQQAELEGFVERAGRSVKFVRASAAKSTASRPNAPAQPEAS